MAKGRMKPPGRPCNLLQLCNYKPFSQSHLEGALGLSPHRKNWCQLCKKFSFPPSFHGLCHTYSPMSDGEGSPPGPGGAVLLMGSWLREAGLPSVFWGARERRTVQGSPSPPTIKAYVDIARDVTPGVGERGHFEKPLESLLSHLFSSWEGSVSRT